ncbi:MAG TPA: thioredoxin domain-containing protein [Deltaproteobacteria bacterium]|nr:thioredoxin domain-containing protein [Deltaproteobacteria bacterium]
MFMNRLSLEKSPYLLQHKDNPVDWHAWGDEAFGKARDENKPIFLSIGYSTCHWCHVMEHDSFEKQEVADVLNKYFISIKLDREERPDIDQIYMNAVVSLQGHGGWPLSVFLTPNKKPFFGATFFWKDQFIALLHKIAQIWATDQIQLLKSADEVVGLFQESVNERLVAERSRSTSPFAPSISLRVHSAQGPSFFTQAVAHFKDNFDPIHGGFGCAPKFPRSIDLSLLLRVYQKNKSPEILNMVTTTLDGMAYGGMYDHLGGGFSRYSTDAQWLVPHFEKMLYDNALLALTYLEGFQVTGKKMYASVAREILDYVLRDMTAPYGGFYSAQDADSEGEEGKYYVWTYDELKVLLSKEEFELFVQVYNVTPRGCFEHGTNILHLSKKNSWEEKQDPLIQSASAKLLDVRRRRIPPLKDDKILTEWNGLMTAAMAKASCVLGESKYLMAAQKAAHFILKNLWDGKKLYRRYRDGQKRFEAVASDYACLIFGLLALNQADLDPEWIKKAEELQSVFDNYFWDEKRGGYFSASKEATDLFTRQKEWMDGATPSSNGVALHNLAMLYSLTSQPGYFKKMERLFLCIDEKMGRYPPGFASSLMSLDGFDKLVIKGEKSHGQVQESLEWIRSRFLPALLVVLEETGEDKIVYTLCQGQECKLPTGDFEEIKKYVSSHYTRN